MSDAEPVAAPTSTSTWINGLKWGQYWDTPGTGTTTIYYAIAGNVTIDYELNGFGRTTAALTALAEEVAAINGILNDVESFINVDFVATTDITLADIVFASVGIEGTQGYLGLGLPPGEFVNPNTGDDQSVILVNRDAYSRDAASGFFGLVPGGFDYITWLHELGHALGLAHPHDTGGTSTIFPGVVQPFNSFGLYQMNQGIYTTMSYNDGWRAGVGALGPSGTARYGWQSTMMGLDIAALQFLYGANTSFANGDSIYDIDTINDAGTGYRSIWDTGGIDTIRHTGNRAVKIDLRAATLANEVGGGGFVSHITGTPKIFAGYTIANGVVIENAIGGNGNDVLIGNSANNSLDGGLGADSMTGGQGDDTYFINNALDTAIELINSGLDIVRSTINWILAANLEALHLLGTAVSATGNSISNAIFGNASANIIDGKAGADQLAGADGNDTYVVDSSLDQITENPNEGTDLVQASASYILLANVENLTLTGAAAINGTGNDLANTIVGNGGANVIDGKSGADILDGGAGLDTVSYASSLGPVTVVLTGAAVSIGSGGDAQGDSIRNFENILGSAFGDTLTGDGLANIIDGGGGADVMAGGLGNDTYMVDNAGDIINEALAGGIDHVKSLVTYSLVGTNLENLTLLGATNINATGNILANSLTGNTGNNRLDGGVGVDTMAGGLGDDTYVVDVATDKVTELAGQGTDTIETTLAIHNLAAQPNIENLTYTGVGNFTGTGNALANTLRGGVGNDLLNGGLGADRLIGAAGSDTYIVDNMGDVADETGGSGIDLVRSAVTFNLAPGIQALGAIENLTLTGAAAINGTGNDLANSIVGNGGANVIEGGGGSDTLDGGTGLDTVSYAKAAGPVTVALGGTTQTFNNGEAGENDSLKGFENIIGSAFADTLAGDGLANVIDGGAGADIMAGGLGNDTYVVSEAGDSIADTGGIELVRSSIAYSLFGTNLENLTLVLGAGNINATGSALANVLTGNEGNNRLDGGLGADTMAGGLGDDTYVVEVATDKVTELAGAGTGTDTIETSLATFSLAALAAVENLTYTGALAFTGTGNALNNIIRGGSGIDKLSGGLGADTMAGGDGNDTYTVDNAGDIIDETSTLGTDLVQSSVSFNLSDGVHAKGVIENLTLTGAAAVNGTGNALANSIVGNGGANVIDGKLGSDILTGGAGKDSFVFSTALGAGNIDKINAYSVADDTIRLDGAIFSTLAIGALAVADFRVGASAVDASDLIIYDRATGALFYDSDGSGGNVAQQFATLNINLNLTAADFLIV